MPNDVSPEERPSRAPERRSAQRVPLETEVSLGSESQFFAGITGDISNGGLFVATYRVLPIGCEVSVDFDLPDGKVQTRGVVRWVRDTSTGAPGLGIAFESISPEDERRVRDFCAKRAPLYHDVDEE